MWNIALSSGLITLSAVFSLVFFLMAGLDMGKAQIVYGFSFLATAISFSLICFQDRLNPWWGVVLANVLLTAAQLLLASGVRLYCGRGKVWPLRFWLYVAAAAASLSYFGMLQPNYQARSIAMSLVLLGCMAEVIQIVIRDRAAISLTVRVPLYILMGGAGFFYLTRLALILVTKPKETLFIEENPVSLSSFLASIAYYALWFGCIILLDLTKFISEAKAKSAELERLAVRDKLTGLFNRNAFDSRLELEIVRQDRYRGPLSLVMADIDHFKRINDVYGHGIGDLVLSEVARRIRLSIRDADTAFRWGGEEFLIIAPNVDAQGAFTLAEKVREAIKARPIEPVGVVTVSLGVAQRTKGESRERWINRVDQVLYRAKAGGRDRVERWEAQTPIASAHVDIDWLTEWDSGNEVIDAEHRELVYRGNELINLALSTSNDQEVQAGFQKFVMQLKTHFADEENILEALGYSSLERHREIHRGLTTELESLQERFAQDAIDSITLFEIVMNKIIVGHMLKDDVDFFPYFKRGRVADGHRP
jgi:diguanylate cyclase (GGDEF)-like protein/hemerythrin-like metal-binding protein